MAETVKQEVDVFLDSWTSDYNNTKTAFKEFRRWLGSKSGVSLEFKARPGVSYSLRATRAEQKERPLFVLVDVVDDDPQARWLSVCFYADMVKDPKELGDFVPQGLLGQDACCLNLEDGDETMFAYIQARIKEAYANAAKF